MTTSEIKEQLIKTGIYSDKDLKYSTKRDMLEMLSGVQTGEATLNVTEETSTIEKAAEKEPPKFTDPEWTDYVLSLFTKQETDEKGNPKTDALRRVAELLLGQFDIRTTVIQPPTGLDGRATVIVSLGFLDGRVVEGAADVFGGNTLREYAVHAVATAETRAEGRALRKALRLTKILAAEETQNADPKDDFADNIISDSMLGSLMVMAEKVPVDLNAVARKEFKVDSAKELTMSQGRLVAKFFNEYKDGTKEIPEEAAI